VSACGFTLLELLVVLAIATLMVAIAAPFTVRTIERAELGADARELAGDLRALRQRAIDQHRPLFFTGRSETLWPEHGGTALHRAVLVPQGGGKALVFYPDGTSSGGVFRLDEGGRSAEVHVAWLSGAISVGPQQ
jgi:general secretion pathway protein H